MPNAQQTRTLEVLLCFALFCFFRIADCSGCVHLLRHMNPFPGNEKEGDSDMPNNLGESG